MNKLEVILEDLNKYSNYSLEDSIKDRLDKTLKNYINSLNSSIERTEIKAEENIRYVAREVNK